jgi:dynein heavy chain
VALQNGVKMTNEPPKGLRANLLRSYLNDPISDPQFFNSVKNAEPFRRMLFGLCFFHALIQERRQFGPLGWNIPYEFNESDLRISIMQLTMFLDDPAYKATGSMTAQQAVPLKALRYLTGECNYGGRVTDDKDRRCLMSILHQLYSIDIHTPGRALSASGLWRTVGAEVTQHREYVAFLEKLPLVSSPEVFNLHENATITKDQTETTALFDAVLQTQTSSGGGSTGGGKSRDETIGDVAADILSRLPPNYDLEAISNKYPVTWSESMNTVLCQELERFNRLLTIVRDSLENVQRAIKGLVVMSAELETVGTDLFFGRIPRTWMSRSYPSLKPLAGYVQDLLARLEFFQRWVDRGVPASIWLPGLFFTQSFLTGVCVCVPCSGVLWRAVPRWCRVGVCNECGACAVCAGVLQNYARRYVIAIDDVGFESRPMRERKDEITAPPSDGCIVYGMFIDGCKWDYNKMLLADSDPKVCALACVPQAPHRLCSKSGVVLLAVADAHSVADACCAGAVCQRAAAVAEAVPQRPDDGVPALPVPRVQDERTQGNAVDDRPLNQLRHVAAHAVGPARGSVDTARRCDAAAARQLVYRVVCLSRVFETMYLLVFV